jgi:hypothetical protein
MLHQKLGVNALMIALTVGAALCYGAFLLYGMWIDGRRQQVRNAGKHPVTESTGEVVAEEDRRDV